MRAKQWIVIGVVTSAAILTVLAGVPPSTRTFRTTAVVGAVFQVPNPVATNTSLLAFDTFQGHDLVSLALGEGLLPVPTNQVLALEIDCGSSQANLVVFDKVLS